MIAKKLRGLGLKAIADDPEYDLQQGFLEEMAKNIVKGTFGWKNG